MENKQDRGDRSLVAREELQQDRCEREMVAEGLKGRAGFQSPGFQLSAGSPGQEEHPTWSPY